LQGIPAERLPKFPETTALALNATEAGRAFARKAASELSVAFEENPLQVSASPWQDLMRQAASKYRLNEFAARLLPYAAGDKPLLRWVSELLEAAIAPVIQPVEALRMQGVSHA